MDNAELCQHGIDKTGFTKQKQPRVGADEEAGPERQDDELQPQILPSARPRDEQSQRKSECHANNSRDPREGEGPPQNHSVQRIGEA